MLDDSTPLADAIIYGPHDSISQILQAGIDLNAFDDYGFKPLIQTAIMNNLPAAGLLLKQHINPNQQDLTGHAALHWAARNNNYALCELLLNHGANPNLPTFGGESPLVDPWQKQNHELVSLLKQYDADSRFAEDYVATKLLGHRFSLPGYANLATPEGEFIEMRYEGFVPRFSLQALIQSLSAFRYGFIGREFRNHHPLLSSIITALMNAQTLLSYQHYLLNLGQYDDSIMKLLQKPLVILPANYEGHAICFVQMGDILARCDRGENAQREGSIVIYRIRNKHLWNLDFIKNLLYKRQTTHTMTRGLIHYLNLQTLDALALAPQTVGNCSWANCEASILASLYLLLRAHQEPADSACAQAQHFFTYWQNWDKNYTLDKFIETLDVENLEQRATKFAILASILFYYCDVKHKDSVIIAERIIDLIKKNHYHYLLKNYLNVYCQHRRPTARGQAFMKLLALCDHALSTRLF